MAYSYIKGNIIQNTVYSLTNGKQTALIRKWQVFLRYTLTTNKTTVSYKFAVGIKNASDKGSMDFATGKVKSVLYFDGAEKTAKKNSSKFTLAKDEREITISEITGSFARENSDATKAITAKAYVSDRWIGTSLATLNLTVPALDKPTIVTEGEMSVTEGEMSASGSAEVTYKIHADSTLNHFGCTSITVQRINSYDEYGQPVLDDEISLTPANWELDGAVVDLPCTLRVTDTSKGNDFELKCSLSSFEHPMADYYITTVFGYNTDYDVSNTFILPRGLQRYWTINYSQSSTPPLVDSDGYATDLTVYAYPYENGAFSDTPQIINGNYKVTKSGGNWSIDVIVGEDYVSNKFSTTPNVKVKADHMLYSSSIPEADTAFFETTKTMNFANGLVNYVFVSGCSVTNYSSRVWFSQYNNPLYFPDTNYVEVGSNDTAVYGLTKVADYMCVVKQGKATDTSIYLLYPTSFEEETSFAVKQGIGGIGADARFAFNIMNEEALFLSQNGVMAIVPTEDESKRVQNRSYFIDRKLAAEDHSQAYSFVYKNMYFLAFPNGHCYVLDGNQRNSWGNDRTNLVYECYYLENVPASNFVKFDEALWFSTENDLCRFKTDDDERPYEDGHYGTEEENFEPVFDPVKAVWSTVFDDDGSLHYQKTMQKKGNVVSILPTDYKYVLALDLTEEEFNQNKKKYYVEAEDGYDQCDAESVYVVGRNYYYRDISGTKVYVKKDANDRIEIQRKFNESSRIPSELYINKKVKKYKRLQFIVENEEPEPFGVDSIIKSYTIGNYAKK